ncbi:MAG: beta-ketoacyl-[acyl-carrier-protein] synthase family protein [Gemmatimonadetes bacterium]|nr:beta-ketoacyl-[acyl-carrier-protein] synthase family protein [Gemmatimonadota bacterium]MDA1102583.1 beta-ketoacyl-[acyl-carrier-protein] synthase family protein [Gemmatimonadota bacterium]
MITGIGPLTAAGIGVEALRTGLRAGRSPIQTVTHFDPEPFRSRMAAEIHDFEPTRFMDEKKARRTDRFVQFALAATRLALDDAALQSHDLDPSRTAVQLGSAMGGIAHAEVQLRGFLERGARALDPRLATTTFAGAASCQIAIEFGISGPNSTNAMSCAAGTMAIAEAARLIREGVVDVALAGGVDAPLAPVCYGAFAALRAMSTRNDAPHEACRPFDAHRDGFVMGEGACVLVIEEAAHAEARGARIYADILGYGTNNDAFHMAAPRPDGSGATDAIHAALATAGLSVIDVDHVNAHGSSTALNDRAESLALRTALGSHADSVSVTGTKPYHGHALGASGAIEVAITGLSILDQWVPPVLNLLEPGEGCDLDYVTGTGRDGRIDVALSNSFGFGGINAVLLLTAPAS